MKGSIIYPSNFKVFTFDIEIKRSRLMILHTKIPTSEIEITSFLKMPVNWYYVYSSFKSNKNYIAFRLFRILPMVCSASLFLMSPPIIYPTPTSFIPLIPFYTTPHSFYTSNTLLYHPLTHFIPLIPFYTNSHFFYTPNPLLYHPSLLLYL